MDRTWSCGLPDDDTDVFVVAPPVVAVVVAYRHVVSLDMQDLDRIHLARYFGFFAGFLSFPNLVASSTVNALWKKRERES